MTRGDHGVFVATSDEATANAFFVALEAVERTVGGTVTVQVARTTYHREIATLTAWHFGEEGLLIDAKPFANRAEALRAAGKIERRANFVRFFRPSRPMVLTKVRNVEIWEEVAA